jgi:hypothetical protein
MESDCGNCGDTPTLMMNFNSKLKKMTIPMTRPKQHWGNALWAFIHTITVVDYIGSNEIYHQKIIPNLQGILTVIPCDACKQMYQKHLGFLLDLDFSQPLILFRWSVDLHNEVNKKLSKKEMSYEDAKKVWCN